MLAGCATVHEGAVRQLSKANVLPLALNDNFQFRKELLALNDPLFQKKTVNQMILFERQRVNFKAITYQDILERRGNYFTLFWRTKHRANVTMRLEYRQQKLRGFLQAKAVDYRGVKGSVKTCFQVTGNEYSEYGRVTAWRAVIIENGKIVALTQSYLWK